MTVSLDHILRIPTILRISQHHLIDGKDWHFNFQVILGIIRRFKELPLIITAAGRVGRRKTVHCRCILRVVFSADRLPNLNSMQVRRLVLHRLIPAGRLPAILSEQGLNNHITQARFELVIGGGWCSRSLSINQVLPHRPNLY